jgi:uncharacterized protein YndB with AHSA1/START domain
MARVEANIVINRPVEEVFAFATNPENDSLWQTGGQDMGYAYDGPVQVGAKAQGESQYLGRRFEWTMEVTEYEPNRKLASEIAFGPIVAQQSLTFEAVEGGTEVTLVMEGEVGGFFRLAGPILIRTIQKDFAASLAKLKDILEAEP